MCTERVALALLTPHRATAFLGAGFARVERDPLAHLQLRPQGTLVDLRLPPNRSDVVLCGLAGEMPVILTNVDDFMVTEIVLSDLVLRSQSRELPVGIWETVWRKYEQFSGILSLTVDVGALSQKDPDDWYVVEIRGTDLAQIRAFYQDLRAGHFKDLNEQPDVSFVRGGE